MYGKHGSKFANVVSHTKNKTPKTERRLNSTPRSPTELRGCLLLGLRQRECPEESRRVPTQPGYHGAPGLVGEYLRMARLALGTPFSF